MNDRQRIVLVIGLAAAIAVLCRATVALALTPDGGWFAYAPDTAVTFTPSDGDVLARAGIWLAGVAVWATASWRILRTRGGG